MCKHAKQIIDKLVTYDNSAFFESLELSEDIDLMICEVGNRGVNELCHEILNLDVRYNTDVLGQIIRKITVRTVIDNSDFSDDVYRLIILCDINKVNKASNFALWNENIDAVTNLNRVYSTMFYRGQHVPFIEINS